MRSLALGGVMNLSLAKRVAVHLVPMVVDAILEIVDSPRLQPYCDSCQCTSCRFVRLAREEEKLRQLQPRG